MYNLLLLKFARPEDIRSSLMSSFDVSSACVDVSDEEDIDSRNWDAWVSCEYSSRGGHVAQSLNIYATNEVAHKPQEGQLSWNVASALQTSVIFPAEYVFSDIWRIVTREGRVGHVRLREPESEGEGLIIAGSNIPIPEVPGVEFYDFPELIRELQLPTPIVDSNLPRVHENVSRSFRGLAVNWERLTVRMSTDWPPDNRYPASMYQEDMELRDDAERLVSQLPVLERPAALETLGKIDDIYRSLTVEDHGHSLACALEESQDIFTRKPWYWRRRPENLPWGGGKVS